MFSFVYPGQGSQFVGMGKDFSENFKQAKQVFEEASDAIHLDMQKLCFESSEDELRLTANTQPALLTTSYAIYKSLEAESDLIKMASGNNSFFSAGHSLGEFTALATIGAMKFSDAVKAVRLRGKLMQKAVPVGVGGMAAVMRLDENKIQELILETRKIFGSKEVLETANFNAPGQIVLSGTLGGLKIAEEVLKTHPAFKGGRLMSLPVSAPFHSSLMEPVKNGLSDFLYSLHISVPTSAYIPNVTADVFEADTESAGSNIKSLLAEQVVSPVRWIETIQTMEKNGTEKIIEIGPKEVLSGLSKRISGTIKPYSINSVETMKSVLSEIQ